MDRQAYLPATLLPSRLAEPRRPRPVAMACIYSLQPPPAFLLQVLTEGLPTLGMALINMAVDVLFDVVEYSKSTLNADPDLFEDAIKVISSSTLGVSSRQPCECRFCRFFRVFDLMVAICRTMDNYGV